MPPMLEPLEARQLRSMTTEAEFATEPDSAQTVIVMEQEADPAKTQAEMNKIRQLYDAISNILRSYNEATTSIIRNLG